MSIQVNNTIFHIYSLKMPLLVHEPGLQIWSICLIWWDKVS